MSGGDGGVLSGVPPPRKAPRRSAIDRSCSIKKECRDVTLYQDWDVYNDFSGVSPGKSGDLCPQCLHHCRLDLLHPPSAAVLPALSSSCHQSRCKASAQIHQISKGLVISDRPFSNSDHFIQSCQLLWLQTRQRLLLLHPIDVRPAEFKPFRQHTSPLEFRRFTLSRRFVSIHPCCCGFPGTHSG